MMVEKLMELPSIISFLNLSLIAEKRITNFLQRENIKEELKADFTPHITYENCSFSYFKETRFSSEQSLMLQNQENVLTGINLYLKKGDVVAIYGSVGSGKSSLLSSINNGLHLTSGAKSVAGRIAIVNQTYWILHDTLRNNILLDRPFEEEFYNEVIRICQLEDDINEMEVGDLTILSENGGNLSGGKKARISLARAVYSKSDILLLDSPFSALDPHTYNLIVSELFSGFLKETIVLCSTQDNSLLELIDKIVFLEKGEVKWEGHYTGFANLFPSEIIQENPSKARRKSTADSTTNLFKTTCFVK